MTNKDKIIYYLTNEWTANTLLSFNTGIDKSNLSKLLKILENENKIERKYEQIGKAKNVWIRLKKDTNSKDNITISNTNSIPIESINDFTPIKRRIRPVSKPTISKYKSITEIKNNILEYCKTKELSEHKRFVKILTADRTQKE
ncbi:hypothetical protein ES702_06210 [subsurface metagenome]